MNNKIFSNFLYINTKFKSRIGRENKIKKRESKDSKNNFCI